MAFDLFRKTPVHTAIVVDEFGALQGLVIRTDLLETVAGDLPKIDARPGPKSRSARTAPTSSMPPYPSPMRCGSPG
jgi:CBS domain containing-hemolysin-like protein